MNANIFGRDANDKPENPMTDTPTVAPLSIGKGLDLTVASKKDSFFQPGDPAINAEDASGPKGPMTMPGGNPMLDSTVSAGLGSGMQYAKALGKDYEGKEAHGKVLKGAQTSTGPIYENQ